MVLGMTRLLTVAGILPSLVASQSIQLFTQENLSVSPECKIALTGNLSCRALETGDIMYQFQNNMSTALLDSMCAKSCDSSIDDYRQSVLQHCSNDSMELGSQTTMYRPIAIADYYFTNREQRCLKDTDGKYCYQKIMSESTGGSCSDCILKLPQVKLSNPFFYNRAEASRYASRTSSCSVTSLPITTASPVVVSSASAAASSAVPTCTGRVVPVEPGDRTDSVARAQNISTWQLLSHNGIPGGNKAFSSDAKLCITGTCQTHLMTANDTCVSLSQRYGISITQLRTWNPTLNGRCSNIDVLEGHYICVTNPGHFTTPHRDTKGGSATTATTAAAVPSDVAPGTNVDCGKYYEVQSGDECAKIALGNEIALKDFMFLNSDLDANCTNLIPGSSYCVQPVGAISKYPDYPTTSGASTTTPPPKMTAAWTPWDQLPTVTSMRKDFPPEETQAPLANGTRKDCEEYKENTYGEVGCWALDLQVRMTDFVTWNPSLFWWNCTLSNATRYCTMLGDGFKYDEDAHYHQHAQRPENAAFNSTDDCWKWHNVTKGETCQTVREDADIGMDAFFGWNPSIRQNCTGLQVSVSYCVSGDGFDDTEYASASASASPTHISTASPTPTSTCPAGSVTAPGQTQSGIPCKCNKYVKSRMGKYCQDMADANDITLKQFLKWNPAVGDSCSNLWPDYYYCVGVST